MKNDKYGLNGNEYGPELKGKAIVFGAGNYAPCIVPYSQQVVRDGENVKALGVNEVGDCIGIIGWHEPTKTIYLFHMNEADEYRLDMSMTHLFANKIGGIRALKDVRYNLVNQNDRSVAELLLILDSYGISRDQISIDLNESQLFIDRETGAISNSHEKYPKEQVAEVGHSSTVLPSGSGIEEDSVNAPQHSTMQETKNSIVTPNQSIAQTPVAIPTVSVSSSKGQSLLPEPTKGNELLN